MGYRDPQIRQVMCFHVQPVEFREAQEAFKLTDTFEGIAKQALERYTRNLMDMWASLQAARKEQHGTETQQEGHAEVRGGAHPREARSGDA